MPAQGTDKVKFTETALRGAYIVDIEPIEDVRLSGYGRFGTSLGQAMRVLMGEARA